MKNLLILPIILLALIIAVLYAWFPDDNKQTQGQ